MVSDELSYTTFDLIFLYLNNHHKSYQFLSSAPLAPFFVLVGPLVLAEVVVLVALLVLDVLAVLLLLELLVLFCVLVLF